MHGDDFTSLATEDQLKWMATQFKKRFEIKDKGILGPESHDLKEIRLLNRIIAWEHDGIRFEADQRHGEILAKQLGLDQTTRGLDLPGSKDTKSDDADEDSSMPISDPGEVTLYRA